MSENIDCIFYESFSETLYCCLLEVEGMPVLSRMWV